MSNPLLPRFLCAAVLLCATTSAQAALLGRLPVTPGGVDYQAYYDDVQDITWLADANYAETSGYAQATGNNSLGIMTWTQALVWVDQLDFGGYTGWRLPFTPQRDPTCDNQSSRIINGNILDDGYNCSGSEMGYLFFEELGNLAMFDGQTFQPDYGLRNAGPFVNMRENVYWSGSTFPGGDPRKWYFGFNDGLQNGASSGVNMSAMAVAGGDPFAPTVVPIPSTLYLFVSGLVWLLGLTRKSR